MKVSNQVFIIGLRMWDRATTFGKILMAEMRGEDFLPSSKLNQMTVEIAELLERHGYPVKYNESYNALRLSLGKDYFQDWLGFTLEKDSFCHTSWSDLREQRATKPISDAAHGVAAWVWSKLWRPKTKTPIE